MRIPTWREVGADPRLLRRLLNVWPPFRFAGIRLRELSDDWSYAVVELKLAPLTRNYVGTQFGGSMFSMTDPFWMVLLMHQLGDEYVVWDRRAEIEFVRPGTSTVRAEFRVDPGLVEEIRQAAAGGDRVLRWLETDIVDRSGEVVARVRRQLYVRLRPPAGAR